MGKGKHKQLKTTEETDESEEDVEEEGEEESEEAEESEEDEKPLQLEFDIDAWGMSNSQSSLRKKEKR